MSDTYNYPAELERDEDGRYVVVFPDFGWGATDGATPEERTGRSQGSAAGVDYHHDAGRQGAARAITDRRAAALGVAIALKAALYEAPR